MPRRGGNLPNRERGLAAHNLSLSSWYRHDIVEKDVKSWNIVEKNVKS